MSEPLSGADEAPMIDPRTAADIVARLVGRPGVPGLLETYTTHPDAGAAYPFPGWRDYDDTGTARGRSAALIAVFARLMEVVIERLNRVPEKHLLAFLDLQGGERLPPVPARAPLSFTLAAGRVEDARVPAGTRVAAPPPPGAKDPVEFATERDLTVSPARLTDLVVADPLADRYGDYGGAVSGFPALAGDRPVEHILYLGDDQLLGYPEIKNLRLRISVDPPPAPVTDPHTLVWECWDGSGWRPLAPRVDPTVGLTGAGTIHFGPLPPQPETVVDGRRGRWLRVRLTTPITTATHAVTGRVRASQLPRLRRIVAAVHLERTLAEGVAPDLGFGNATPLDLGKPFFPFGERPRRFDTLFLASAEVFSKDRTACLSDTSARVELGVTLSNPRTLAAADSVRPSPDLALVWECWNGAEWEAVGTSTAPPWLELVEPDPEVVPGLDAAGAPEALVQGTAAPGTIVRIQRVFPQAGAAHMPRVGADGRFATRLPVIAGFNVIEISARRGTGQSVRTEQAWTVVTVPADGENQDRLTLEPVVAPGTEPIVQAQVSIAVKLSGDWVGEVKALRVTNGRTGEVVTGGRDSTLAVELLPGRNSLLIEACSVQRVLAATVLWLRRAAPPPGPAGDFADGTYGLTESGVVRLRLPATTARTAVNGQDGFWLRTRIIAGDYGREASYVLKDPAKPEDGFLLVPASFRPPVVAAVRLGYELTPRRPPRRCLAYNDLAYRECAADGNGAFAPFAPGEDLSPALYLGFTLPGGQTRFPRGGLDLYAQLESTLAEPVVGGPAAGPDPGPDLEAPPRIVWEYWNGAAWAGLAVADGTAQFTHSGTLSLLPPADFVPCTRGGRERWWLRARLAAGTYTTVPRLAWLRLNTVSALQVASIANETLGSSNGNAGQVFRSARAPVLAGVRLEVREAGAPGAAELKALAAGFLADGETLPATGADLLAPTAGRGGGVWVRWREVPDFHGSGAGDRHFVLNHLTGEVRFGDGANGRIPPRGTSSIRLARYRTGGGAAGNVAAHTITQLKTTVPYVDQVTNPEPATGGAEAETLAALKARIPRGLRHQDRAVTPEDLEDLALLASTEVARVLCVPLRDLEADPQGAALAPGTASVIVVPQSADPKPRPTRALLERVRDFLGARADATARLAVVGPQFVKVSVEAEVAVSAPSLAGAAEAALRTRLDAFLHPLTGGADGRGWDFGRAPHRSDFFALIEQTPGVDHCRRLEIGEAEDAPGVRTSGRFLVYAGVHRLDLLFVTT